MGDRIRSTGELRRDHGIERNHGGSLSIHGTHVNLGDVFRRGSKLRLSLRLHPIDTAEFEEVIDVEIAEIGLQRVEHFGDRHAQRFGSLSVHMSKDSRRAHAKAGADRSDRRVLSGFGEKLLGHARELVEIPAAGILKLKGKSARGAESSDGRGVKGQNQRLGNFRELSIRGADQGLHVILRSLPLVPVVQG